MMVNEEMNKGNMVSNENSREDHNIAQLIKEQKEWAKYVVFCEDGKILAASDEPLFGEIDGFLKLFNTRDDAITTGIVYLNQQYDVHRYHPPLIYGRRGDSSKGEGEGIAVYKSEKSSTNSQVYALITYIFPTISARAVPQLVEFCKKNLV